MPITQLLENNAAKFSDRTALVEINPEVTEMRRVTWKEYELIEQSSEETYRREITWSVFNEKANRCANLLMSRGIKKGDKVGILLMNGLEWLPIYFGILKTGALAVPLNYRYTSSEIKYCLDLADTNAIIFGPEFIGRMEEIAEDIPKVKLIFYVGDNCPTFALQQTIQVLLLKLSLLTRTMLQSTSHQVRPVSLRLFFTITKALCTQQELNRNITARLRMTFSSAFLRFTTPEPKCTGSEALSPDQRLFFSKA